MATLDRRTDEQAFAWGLTIRGGFWEAWLLSLCVLVQTGEWTRCGRQSGQRIRREWEWGIMCPDVLTDAGSSTLNPYLQY